MSDNLVVGKPNNRKPKKPRQGLKRVKADEVYTYGPITVARYGSIIQLENNATPEEQARLQKALGAEHKRLFGELAKAIEELQGMLGRCDPASIMYRASYEVIPFFHKYKSESEYQRNEALAHPTLEYLQYLIARTPFSERPAFLTEAGWAALWKQATHVMELTSRYLNTRDPNSNSHARELMELRQAVDMRRFAQRGRRYPTFTVTHWDFVFSTYQSEIKEAYGIEADDLVAGLTAIRDYMVSAPFERELGFVTALKTMMNALAERGCNVAPNATEKEKSQTMSAMNSEEFSDLRAQLDEAHKLAHSPAVFDFTHITTLPASVLETLSVHPGESILTTLTGPNHDDLSPLSPSVLRRKPFLQANGKSYVTYHSGLMDWADYLIEKDLMEKLTDRKAGMERARAEKLESLACELFAEILSPDCLKRNLFYPNPDSPGDFTEIDAIVFVDDVLLLVEVKSGGFSEASNRGAPDSLKDDLFELIIDGARQAERAERYIRSQDEALFFDRGGQQEKLRLRSKDYRQIFRVVVTREDLGWIGARVAHLGELFPQMGVTYPWHISIDDLRIFAHLFHMQPARFTHYLELRLAATNQLLLHQNDEIEHLGLYFKFNYYHDIEIVGLNRLSFDASHMRYIDHYFMDLYNGEETPQPGQRLPPRLQALILSLENSFVQGRLHVSSVILHASEEARLETERALHGLDVAFTSGRKLSYRTVSEGGYGLTLTCVPDGYWDRELKLSYVQMQQSNSFKWLVLQLTSPADNTVGKIRVLVPGDFSPSALTAANQHFQSKLNEEISELKPGRNERCPCGSGKKFKHCHGH